VLAFARDAATRVLAPIAGLSNTDTPTLRGLGHLLEEGLGTVVIADAAPLVAALTAGERATLAERAIVLGRCSVFARELVKGRALASRVLLLRTAGRRVPEIAPGRTSVPRRGGDAILVALGFVPIGPRAVRADVAERLVTELATAADVPLTSLLGCNAAEAERVRAALRASTDFAASFGREVES
jgi:ATP-dependent RNA helicase SUPV3L1/SUV3